MKDSKVLHLTLKKQWYDMILSGEKKEEYREIKMFWARRLCYKIPHPSGGYLSCASDILQGKGIAGWNEFTGGCQAFESFDFVHFARGGHFHPSIPQFNIECKGIHIGEGRPEWGAEPRKEYFVIRLGVIVRQ